MAAGEGVRGGPWHRRRTVRRPGVGATARGFGEGDERGPVETTGDDQDRTRARFGQGGSDPGGHVLLAGPVRGVGLGVAADHVEVEGEPFGEER